MPDWLTESWSYIKERDTLFAWIGGLSILVLIISAIAVPIVIRRMPYDYFLENGEVTEAVRDRHPILRIAFLIVKNLIGAVLLLGGIIMLLTPGQGILTMMIGLMLMDFPGKRRFEIWLVRNPLINRAIQWMRKRAGKRPLELPESQPVSSS